MKGSLIFFLYLLFIAASCKQRPLNAELQGVSKSQQGADQSLKQKVANSKVQGRWISIPLFNGQKQDLFLLEGLDLDSVNSKNGIFLLRSEPSAKMLSEAIEEGVPIVIATMPSDFSAFAACMRHQDSPRVEEILSKHNSKFKSSASIIVIEASADEFVFAHELQHWRDFQADDTLSGPSVFKQMSDKMVAFLNSMIEKKIIEKEEALNKYADLTQLYIEVRGHQAMIIRAKYLFENKLKYYDGGLRKLMQFSDQESLGSYSESVNDIYFSIYRDQLVSKVRVFFQQAIRKKIPKAKEFADFYVSGDLIPWEQEKSISLRNIVLK